MRFFLYLYFSIIMGCFLLTSPVIEASIPTTLSSNSAFGKKVSLAIDDNPNFDTEKALVCWSGTENLKAVKLWNITIDQGTIEPLIKLSQDKKNCFELTNILFLHSGTWEIRLNFADGDEALFNVTIQDESRALHQLTANGMAILLIFPEVPTKSTHNGLAPELVETFS